MYKVIIVKVLFEKKNEMATAAMEKELTLPFAPFEGLYLSSGSWLCGALEKIQWDDEDQAFYCSVGDKSPEYVSDSDATMEDTIRAHETYGWTNMTGKRR